MQNDYFTQFAGSEVGRYARAYGYYLWHSGGGCFALRRDFPNGDYVLVTDNDVEVPIEETSDTKWQLGIYTADGDSLLYREYPQYCLESVLRTAAVMQEYYVTMYDDGEDADYQIFSNLKDASKLAVEWWKTFHANEDKIDVRIYRQYLDPQWFLDGGWSWWSCWNKDENLRDLSLVATYHFRW